MVESINKLGDGWLTIGKYDLRNWGGGKVHIGCNYKSDANGEGGEFDEPALEAVIKEFYDKHF